MGNGRIGAKAHGFRVGIVAKTNIGSSTGTGICKVESRMFWNSGIIHKMMILPVIWRGVIAIASQQILDHRPARGVQCHVIV